MTHLLANQPDTRFGTPRSAQRPSNTKQKLPAPHARAVGLLLGLLFTANAYAQQNPSSPASGAAPVPIETAYYITFRVKPGKNVDFEKAVGAMMDQVEQNEPDNIYCDLFHVPNDPQSYAIMERYKTLEASRSHSESDYIKRLGAALSNNMLDGPPGVQAIAFIRSK